MAKLTKTQLQAKLDELGVEYPADAKNSELKALLDQHDPEGDDVPPDIAGLDDDDDDDDDEESLDPVVGGSIEADDDDAAGLTTEDAAEYRKALVKQKQQSTLMLPKEPERTPKGKKVIYVVENLSTRYGGKHVVLVAGKPLPKGVLSTGQIAHMFEQRKLSASKPRARGSRRSVLGLS